MRKKMVFFTVGLLIWGQAMSYGALSLQDLRLPKNFFPSQISHATINSVQEDPEFPGFLKFVVFEPHGRYIVEGLADLRQCLHEIDVIEQLDSSESTGGDVAEGAVDSLKDTGTGLKNLVVHPVDSVEGIGKGIGKLGGKIGDFFGGEEEGEKSSMGESFLGSTKRKLAKQLGVDVYSRNPDLQRRLEKITKARMGGRGAAMVAELLLPVGFLASVVLTASGINSAADQLVNDNSRGDLYKLNEKALMKSGFSQSKVIRLLNRSYYTPRELTYLRFYFEKFQGIPGSRTLMDAAIAATPGVPAQKLLHEMQIAADSMTTMPDVTEIRLTSEGIILERTSTVILITGYDYLDVSKFGKKIADYASGLRLKLGKRSVEIWNAGNLSLGFTALLLTKGIQYRRMCLFGKTMAAEQP